MHYYDTPCTVNLRLSIEILVFSLYESAMNFFLVLTIVLSKRQGYFLISMESCSSSLISKDCCGIFTVYFSLLFSLRKFEKQTYLKKPRGEVF